MKLKSLSIIALSLAFSALLTSCGTKKEDPKPEPAKTLNKTTLLNKVWYSKSGSGHLSHEFKSNGTYAFDGTWKWLNNSDTMEIVMSAGEPSLKWRILWNTDHEMECRWINNAQDILMKDQLW